MDDTKQEGARDPWSSGEATVHQLPEWGSLSFFWAFFSLLVSFMSQFLFDHCSNVKRIWLTAIFFRGLADKSYKGKGLSLKTGSEAEPLQDSNLRAKRESKESEITKRGKGDKKKTSKRKQKKRAQRKKKTNGNSKSQKNQQRKEKRKLREKKRRLSQKKKGKGKNEKKSGKGNDDTRSERCTATVSDDCLTVSSYFWWWYRFSFPLSILSKLRSYPK